RDYSRRFGPIRNWFVDFDLPGPSMAQHPQHHHGEMVADEAAKLGKADDAVLLAQLAEQPVDRDRMDFELLRKLFKEGFGRNRDARAGDDGFFRFVIIAVGGF